MIAHDELRLILDDWNFWNRELSAEITGHPRRLVEKIREIATGREVVAIAGVRRCGKTTILFQLMDHLLRAGQDRRNLLYVNLEDHRFALHLEPRLLDRILTFYREEVNPTGPSFLFLDEPQEIEGWEKWVRSLYDREPDTRIFVTGSSSSMMSSELSTLLTGRNLTFLARPFSFAEHLSFIGVEATSTPGPVEAYRENLRNREVLGYHIIRYMEHGGFPEALKSTSDLRWSTLLQQYFDDILSKDVAHRHRLRNHSLLKDLALVLMSNVANLMSLGKTARTLGTSASSILSLMDHLEDAQLISTAHFFSFSTMETVAAQKPRKVYSVDTGMRNAVVSRATRDLGRLAENLVHSHLVSLAQQPRYWRENVEVDIVVGRGQPLPVNVCFADEIPPREIQGLERFNEKFSNPRAWLITKNTFREETIGSSECTLIPLWAYLLADEPNAVA